MFYAILAPLLLLAAACGGNGIISPPPDPSPSGIALTRPLALTPPLASVTPPTEPAPPPTAIPATMPPTLTPGLTPMPGPTPTPTPGPTPMPTLPPIAANQRIPYVQIAAGKYHSCGLRADGVAHCWGSNPNGNTDVPARMRFRQISAGLNFTCGIRYAGDIACWGDNSYGQAAPPPGLFTQLAAGRRHGCALDSSGTAVCWGDVASPSADFAFQAIGGGFRHSCGLTVAGDLECWGAKGATTSSHPGPFTVLAVGLRHSCALRPNGAALCYGDNAEYQADAPATAFTHIAAGWYHSCGITRDAGVIECWGARLPGRSEQRLAAPAGVFSALSSGWQNNCALRTDGRIQCWRQPYPDLSLPSSENLSPAFGGRVFDFPIELFPWPTGGLTVVERAGVIRLYSDGDRPGTTHRPILDLTDIVDTFGERGMLSVALDPNFDEFPFLYVYYHRRIGPDRLAEGRLSRFPVVDGAAVPADELIILTVPKLAIAVFGGSVRFGPDGMLYLSLGDNVNIDNPQNMASLYGKIIRIDIRGATPKQPYRIPDDNPFVDLPGARPEIWAYGLRNPWRMNFDADGNLWVADVGDLAVEEVSIVTAGANMGWPIFEGNLCLSGAAQCAALAATAPLVTYNHDVGRAIIGGVTNPQPDIPYIFGDFATGHIWAMERDAAAATGWRKREIARSNGNILSFGVGAAGEVYVLLRDRPIQRLEW